MSAVTARSVCASVAMSLMLVSPASARRQATSRDDTLRRHGVDPTAAFVSRVGPPANEIMTLLEEPGQPRPVPHTLTATEREDLEDAFASLPPLLRRTLTARLRRLSFVEGMPNTALTSTVNPGEPYTLFDLTVRAGVLHETASEWLTWKERSLYDLAGTHLTVTVDAGRRSALLLVLLHEGTHAVDNVEHITPAFRPPAATAGATAETAFTAGVWRDRTTPVTRYRDALLETIVFRPQGRVLPASDMRAIYAALQRTPFASVYGSTNWYDDLAELTAVHHWTDVLHQPYRILVRDGDRVVTSYAPMSSQLVRSRLDQVARFYDSDR